MAFFPFLPFVASILGLLLAAASLVPSRRSFARWCFAAGMVALSLDSYVSGLALRTSVLSDTLQALTLGLIIKSFVPAAWLGFSLAYSRGDFRTSLKRLSLPLAITVLLPIGLSLGYRQQLIDIMSTGQPGEPPLLHLGVMAKVLNGILLIAHVWILTNLEQTFRSAVGTMRWRIKFVVLGLGLIFGARLYARSQGLLYSIYDVNWSAVESIAFLIGCGLLVLAYLRSGVAEIDVYPSQAVLGSSVTVLMTGAYLFIVGILANIIKEFGGEESFQLQIFVVLLGMAGLALLLLSDRLRQRVHSFVNRHFARAQHDSVRIWTEFSRRLGNVKDQAGLCSVSVSMVSETFEVLSVSIWLVDEQTEKLTACGSTAPQTELGTPGVAAAPGPSGLLAGSSPFDLEGIEEPWADELRRLNPTTFPNGGDRWCVPLRAGARCLGAFILADRVNGATYTIEQLSLLQCMADQVTSVLLNLRLANEVARSRELEAFRTMSAFFVHDLKNAASSLNLMLKNLPVHFDDPEFRADALRGIGNTARRIDGMIGRLTDLRQRPQLKPVEADVNQLVSEVLDRLEAMPNIELTRELGPLPLVLADRDQIRSVVTNLLLNARDALSSGGRIQIRTEKAGGNVVLTVVDNGCGMSPEFVRDSLFRPFQSTKQKGLGIGMFQARMIIEAHGGSIRVESETGKGTTFRVSLPVEDGA
ncbi:XrtA/PEP-CTERM system histidine kinase PrsK [Paludibaculum fermentans]|uniref:XrtA/PEP-CTERM system histidine kinase PrsK n=1 Tax=Paludibaculum fermentans TaxID=1473598 RepID=UPI003EBFCBDC